MLSLFRGGTGELAPESVQVTVRNGTGVPRQGAEATAALAGVGFAATVAGDELGAGADGTVVRYPPGKEAAADLVARWLAGGARLEEVDGPAGHRGGHRHRLAGSPHRGHAVDARRPPPTTLPDGTTTTSRARGVVARARRPPRPLDLASVDC